MKQDIVLLHGLLGDLSNWDGVVAHFSPNHTVHIPGLPIYTSPKEHILEYLVNSLHDYVQSASLNDVILIGNSLGGHVAILYTHKYPENVSTLILTGSSGLYEKQAFGTFPRRHSYTYIRQKVADTFYDSAIATPQLVDQVFATISDNEKCIRIIRTARATQRNYVTDILPEIKTPVLLIWGTDDQITPMHVAEEFHRSLPNSQLATIDKCGHAPMMEHPEKFNSIVEAFLK